MDNSPSARATGSLSVADRATNVTSAFGKAKRGVEIGFVAGIAGVAFVFNTVARRVPVAPPEGPFR